MVQGVLYNLPLPLPLDGETGGAECDLPIDSGAVCISSIARFQMMQWRLRQRGYTVVDAHAWDQGPERYGRHRVTVVIN